jgi:hypothetical protein
VLAVEVQTLVGELLQSFGAGEDTAEQRRAINTLLRRMDLRLTLDPSGQRLGMAIGDGEPAWQPILGDLAGEMLRRGAGDAVYEERQVGREWIDLAGRAVASGGMAVLVLPDGTEIRLTPEQFQSLAAHTPGHNP